MFSPISGEKHFLSKNEKQEYHAAEFRGQQGEGEGEGEGERERNIHTQKKKQEKKTNQDKTTPNLKNEI